MAGRNEEAIQHARSALELFPDSFLACLVAGWTLGGSGLLEEAAAAVQRGLQSVPGNVWLLTVLAGTYGRQGKIEEVMGILRDLEARQDVPPLVLGMLHAASRNLEQAFHWLDRAVEERHVWTSAVLRIPLYCEPLAGPRYDALLRKMKMA